MAIQLFQTADVEEQWQSVAGPWLREQAGAAWRTVRPTVVLTPGRAEGFYLRSRMVRERVPFLGLHFWTPSDARAFLLGQKTLGVEPATRAELRLVARACAETLAREPEVDEPSLASVAREPDPFLRAYDLLLGAGWDPTREGAAYGRRLAREMERALAERGIATQAALHRMLWRKRAKMGEPLLARLLVVGFNAAHWPLWDLLRATVAEAESATMGLIAPAVFAEQVDQLWIGSWEETAAASLEIPGGAAYERESPFVPWIKAYEAGTSGEGTGGDFTFLATTDWVSQVRAVTLQALDFLKRDSCERLGIVFPEANALTLGVADQLRRLGVPLDDGTGCLQPGCFERRHWQAWLKFQEEPSVQRLTEWVRGCEADGVSCGAGEEALTARDLADTLDEALGDSLVDQLEFLALHLEENSSRRRARTVAEFLRGLIQLPEEARFAEFLEMTLQALKRLDWTPQVGALEQGPPPWLRESRWKISRRTFLEWLKESSDSRERSRGPEGNHFYGKVHLLIYAQMPGQTWTHLILTGLNEGQWPRFHEAAAFGSRYELMTLNQQSRTLNRRGTTQGRQGAGHEIVREDRGHCLLPVERQDLALRDLCAALAGTSSAVCLSAMTTEGGRMLLPSDFFNHAYQEQTGRVLDEAAFRGLARTTEEWARRHADFLGASLVQGSPGVAATGTAYAARRNPMQPFGPYEFAYAEAPREPIQLSCKKWEDAWNHPASVWLGDVVGVRAWPEGKLAWPRAVGTWVHRWLASSLQLCGERKTPGDFLRELRAAADREPERIRALAERAGMELYPWWNHVWRQARSVALGLAESVAPQLRERHFLAEYRLPPNLLVALPGTERADFHLKGRIDLLLIDMGARPFDPASGKFTDGACWVIDFKTGSAKNLNEKRLEKGIGLQAMLYALAVRAAGADSVQVSLHAFDAGVLKPQVNGEQVAGNATLFRSLDRFHREGIFGMRAEAENDYGFAPRYPMATRSIAPGILEAKWVLTHGMAALEEEA